MPKDLYNSVYRRMKGGHNHQHFLHRAGHQSLLIVAKPTKARGKDAVAKYRIEISGSAQLVEAFKQGTLILRQALPFDDTVPTQWIDTVVITTPPGVVQDEDESTDAAENTPPPATPSGSNPPAKAANDRTPSSSGTRSHVKAKRGLAKPGTPSSPAPPSKNPRLQHSASSSKNSSRNGPGNQGNAASWTNDRLINSPPGAHEQLAATDSKISSGIESATFADTEVTAGRTSDDRGEAPPPRIKQLAKESAHVLKKSEARESQKVSKLASKLVPGLQQSPSVRPDDRNPDDFCAWCRDEFASGEVENIVCCSGCGKYQHKTCPGTPQGNFFWCKFCDVYLSDESDNEREAGNETADDEL